MVICGGCAPEHAGIVHGAKDDLDVDAAAQGIMLECESEEAVLRHASHTRDGNSLRMKLSEVRKNGDQWWLRPDGKTW